LLDGAKQQPGVTQNAGLPRPKPLKTLERVKGIEPSSSAWKVVDKLNDFNEPCVKWQPKNRPKLPIFATGNETVRSATNRFGVSAMWTNASWHVCVSKLPGIRPAYQFDYRGPSITTRRVEGAHRVHFVHIKARPNRL
jgi:hypothetical protein